MSNTFFAGSPGRFAAGQARRYLHLKVQGLATSIPQPGSPRTRIDAIYMAGRDFRLRAAAGFRENLLRWDSCLPVSRPPGMRFCGSSLFTPPGNRYPA